MAGRRGLPRRAVDRELVVAQTVRQRCPAPLPEALSGSGTCSAVLPGEEHQVQSIQDDFQASEVDQPGIRNRFGERVRQVLES